VKSTVLTSSPSEEVLGAWNDCLDCAEFASHYTSPEFFREPYFCGLDQFAILARDETGRVCGVLTGLRRGSQLVCGAEGSPQLCFRRDVDLPTAGLALATGLVEYAASSDQAITVYSWSPIEGFARIGFRSRTLVAPLGTIVLDLSRGSERLFKEFSQTRRNQIRRAMREKVEISEMDVTNDFDDYYALYAHWCGFKGVPAHPYELQRSVFEMQGNRLILVARHRGKMIGVSTFRFRRPGIIEYAANVSRREETKVRQNDLLIWKAIEWAAKQPRIGLFSFAGAHFFLQMFGGQMRPVHRYRIDRTLFRRHDLKENLKDAAMGAFRVLPPGVRTKLKAAWRRGDGDG
jgi:hypothetical protein